MSLKLGDIRKRGYEGSMGSRSEDSAEAEREHPLLPAFACLLPACLTHTPLTSTDRPTTVTTPIKSYKIPCSLTLFTAPVSVPAHK